MFRLGSLVLGLVILFTIGLSACSVETVNPGYAGLIYNRNGGLENKVLKDGWHWVWPTQKLIEFPVSTENAYYISSKTKHEGRTSDDSLVVGTKDGKPLKLEITPSYHMDKNRLPQVFSKFRGRSIEEIEYGYMRTNTQRIINDITSQYPMMDIIGEKKPEINDKIFKAVYEFFDNDGIIIETCGAGGMEPDEQTKVAIQAVVDAQNRQRQAEIERQTAIITANTAREKARGEADAATIVAKGQAAANEALQRSLTSEIVQYEWIKKWNGQQPSTQLSGNSGAIVNLR